MSEKLYELKEQLVQIDSILEMGTDAESKQILEETKATLLSAIDNKLENVLEFISSCKGKMEYLKSEEERIYAKRKSLEQKVEWLRNLVFETMKEQNLKKADYGTWTCTVSKAPAKLVLTDEAEVFLPDTLCRVTKTPNKTAIKEYMGDSKEFSVVVDGKPVILATIEDDNEVLRIK